MNVAEAFGIALNYARATLDSYHETLVALCQGVPVPDHDIELRRRMAHEAERDFRSLQITLFSLIADQFQRQKVIDGMEKRAVLMDTLLADMDRARIVAKKLLTERAEDFLPDWEDPCDLQGASGPDPGARLETPLPVEQEWL